MVHFRQTFFVYLELIMHFSIRDAGANCIGRPFILSHQKLVVAYEKKIAQPGRRRTGGTRSISQRSKHARQQAIHRSTHCQ